MKTAFEVLKQRCTPDGWPLSKGKEKSQIKRAKVTGVIGSETGSRQKVTMTTELITCLTEFYMAYRYRD